MRREIIALPGGPSVTSTSRPIGHRRLDIPGRGDQQDAVAAMKRRQRQPVRASAAAADARNDEIPAAQGPDLGDGLAVDGGIDDLDGKTPGRQVFLRPNPVPGGGLFMFHVDVQQVVIFDQREMAPTTPSG